MMKIIKLIVPLLVVLSATSCASIVSRSIYPVTFNSTPEGAAISVRNRDGLTVYQGLTPATVPLSSSAGYMRPEQYTITFQLPGHQPQTLFIGAQLNGWYFGNLFLGGLLGMLIVDPATGAMYRIPEGVIFQPYLEPDGTEPSIEFKKELKILDVNDLPDGIDKSTLVPLEL